MTAFDNSRFNPASYLGLKIVALVWIRYFNPPKIFFGLAPAMAHFKLTLNVSNCMQLSYNKYRKENEKVFRM